jgi:ribosomal protein S18 acetylase RimI-like enzyme
MQIISCASIDIQSIFDLYEKATEYQKTKFDKHWLGFETDLIAAEINEKRLWKIVSHGQISCIFSVAFSDPFIWHEKNDRSSLYIHRIATNPLNRGQGFFKVVVEWAKHYGRGLGKQYIRMDTWADNRKLIKYYQKCGFRFMGVMPPAISPALPKHYEKSSICLLEMNIES